MKRLIIITLSTLLAAHASLADFPEISQGDITPNDRKLGKPIGESKPGELTIASFNIRNLGTRGRTLKDFAAIADLIDEADVVLIQEAGLGLYRGEEVTDKQATRMKAVVAVLQINLGDDWNVFTADHPTGTGAGTETAILAHRNHGNGFAISGQFKTYVDLGDKRDMAVFRLKLAKGSDKKELLLGSVHLTPEDPDRGEQMEAAADWLVSQGDKGAIVMGDFNWGYRKTSGVENYKGEDRVAELHAAGKIYQLFAPLSYLGKGDATNLRTNMGFRKSAYFYDQFLMTPKLAGKMADGGAFLDDCGVVAFGVHDSHMKDVIGKDEKRRGYGFNRYLKHAILSPNSNQTAFDKTQKDIKTQAQNSATFIISDHRVVWMQLKMWE